MGALLILLRRPGKMFWGFILGIIVATFAGPLANLIINYFDTTEPEEDYEEEDGQDCS